MYVSTSHINILTNQGFGKSISVRGKRLILIKEEGKRSNRDLPTILIDFITRPNFCTSFLLVFPLDKCVGNF